MFGQGLEKVLLITTGHCGPRAVPLLSPDVHKQYGLYLNFINNTKTETSPSPLGAFVTAHFYSVTSRVRSGRMETICLWLPSDGFLGGLPAPTPRRAWFVNSAVPSLRSDVVIL